MSNFKFPSLFVPLGVLIFSLYSLAKQLCKKIPEHIAIVTCAVSFVFLLIGFVQQLLSFGQGD